MRWGAAAKGFVATAGLAVVLAAPASASTIKVTTTADDFNNNGDDCALREAVQSANSDSDFGGCVRKGTGVADTIRLTGGQTYTRTFSGGAENANQTGDLDVFTRIAVEVRGEGKATIDGNLIDRGIQVLAGGALTASRLIVTNGSVFTSQPGNDTAGGGIAVSFDGKLNLRNSDVVGNHTINNENCACGGGIGVQGKTSLRRVNVEGNNSFGVGGGVALVAGRSLRISDSRIYDNESGLLGGGLYLGGVESKARVSDVTVAENETTSTGSGSGGGMHIGGSGLDAKISNSTIARNEALVNGGGINVAGLVRLNAVTISDNAADADSSGTGSGGGISGPPQRIRNSIVAGNSDLGPVAPENDCADSFAGSHNLYGLDGGCSVGNHDEATLDARLQPLALNGGFGETMALKRNSPAIGLAAKSAPKRDQRGAKRDRHPDAGAYER